MLGIKFPEMEKIDVTICTFNSDHKLRECISSIIEYININKLIVVDGNSTDKTHQIIESFNNQINIDIFIKPELNLGQSRSFSFSKVTTTYFLQIDSDVVLDNRSLDAFSNNYMKGDVVEFGIDNIFSFPYPPENIPSKSSYTRRGFFFANLMKADIVNNIQIDVSTHEEEYLRRVLANDGKSWIKTKKIIGAHYSQPVRYKNRRNVASVRIVPIGKSQYIDRGIVYGKTNESFTGILRELLIIVSESFNLSGLLNSFKGMSNPFANIYYFLLAFFRSINAK